MSDNEILVGKLVADRYRVVRRLGAGGMGTVYVAIQEQLGREVALKVVRRDLSTDERTLERFRREALSLSQAHHPHIVTLHDFGELPSGALWIAMELVKGENLRQRLVRDGPLSVKKSIALVRDTASALTAAHALNIIHRDLKPENILLMEAAGSPDFVKIVDFGVAKITDAEEHEGEHTLTARGSVVGTPGYIAPEVSVRGVTTDPRSDLYSLGVVWFECLVGRAPFRAATATALLMAHALDPIPSMPDRVPLAVAGLVQRLLAKAPEDRPESAEELVALIDALPPFDESGASIPRIVGPMSNMALVEMDAATVNDVPRVTPSGPRPAARPVDDVVSAPTARPDEARRAVSSPATAPVPPVVVVEAPPARRRLALVGAMLAGAAATAAVVLPLVLSRGPGPTPAASDAGPVAPVGTPGVVDAGAPAAQDAGPAVVDAGAPTSTAPDAGPRKKRPKGPRHKNPDGTYAPDIYDD
jgi:serine/threonine-protein kinase